MRIRQTSTARTRTQQTNFWNQCYRLIQKDERSMSAPRTQATTHANDKQHGTRKRMEEKTHTRIRLWAKQGELQWRRARFILNITPGTQSLRELPKTCFSLRLAEFFVHFFVEPWSNQQFFGHPSSELPCFETVKHAISRICPSFLVQICGASDSQHFVF